MKKNDLFKKNGIIYRILYLDNPKVLLIDCFKKSFPKWFYNEFLDNVILVTEDELKKELKEVEELLYNVIKVN